MAKKRYHGTKLGNDMYSGYKSASKMKSSDSRMIAEAPSSPCLLPEHVIDKDFPSIGKYSGGYIPDLFSGSQRQMVEDTSDLKRETKPKKY